MTTADRLSLIAQAYGTHTRTELALLCDVSRVTLWRWVSGRTQPDRHELAQLELLEANAPANDDLSTKPARMTSRGRRAALCPPTPPAISTED